MCGTKTNFAFVFCTQKKLSPAPKGTTDSPLTQPYTASAHPETAAWNSPVTAILSLPFQWGGDSSLREGARISARTLCASWENPAAQAQYHRRTALRYFCSETWKSFADSSVFNCMLILTGNSRAVNMRHLLGLRQTLRTCVLHANA